MLIGIYHVFINLCVWLTAEISKLLIRQNVPGNEPINDFTPLMTFSTNLRMCNKFCRYMYWLFVDVLFVPLFYILASLVVIFTLKKLGQYTV